MRARSSALRFLRPAALCALVAVGCGFDTSGEPTSGGSGVGSASESSSGASAATETSTTAASAGADASPESSGIPVDTSSGPIEATTDAGDATSMTDPTTGPAESSTGAEAPICGNGMIEAGEECETGDLGGFVCTSLGDGYSGEPACAGCQIDVGPCCVADGVLCAPVANDCCNGCGLDFMCG